MEMDVAALAAQKSWGAGKVADATQTPVPMTL